MSCHKLAFRTVEQAQRTMAVVASFAPGKPQPVRLYECPECGLMHLTSKEQRHIPGDSTVAVLPPVAPLFQPNTPEPAHTPAPTRAERDEALRARALARMEEQRRALEEKRAAKEAEKARKAAAHAENEANRKRKLQALSEQPAWMKDKCREIAAAILHGRHYDAFLLADAIGGLPARVGRAEADAWVAENIAERREWFAETARERNPADDRCPRCGGVLTANPGDTLVVCAECARRWPPLANVAYPAPPLTLPAEDRPR